MEALHLPDNIKVHWAGSEVQVHFMALNKMGVRYNLYTAYPFVERLIFDKPSFPIFPLKDQKDDPAFKIAQNVIKNSAHTIQDSGLFTLMFGGHRGKHDSSLINKWYDGLVEYSSKNSKGATLVEVDCQKVLGVKEAWAFSERMRKDLPDNRIINVYHIEDGRDGLDRLIDFSDYIAISVPELRRANKKEYVYTLARYMKKRKPSIDIHLLGCTELSILKQCNFCTSADSTTYSSCVRFGFIDKHHIKQIDTQKVKEMVGSEVFNAIHSEYREDRASGILLSIMKLKEQYQKACGNQDYYLKV